MEAVTERGRFVTAFLLPAREDQYMTAIANARLTVAEYLAIERKAATRSEFFAGQMVPMPRSRREHILISGNLSSALNRQLRDCPKEVYCTAMRVRVPSGLYTYPDVVVACGNPRFEDDHVDILLNPIVLIEVLSESTADYDRGTKFKHYRQISSLREYVLVDQSSAQIEQFVLGDDGVWKLAETKGLDATLTLDSIGCRVPLAEVYRKVSFPADGQTGVA